MGLFDELRNAPEIEETTEIQGASVPTRQPAEPESVDEALAVAYHQTKEIQEEEGGLTGGQMAGSIGTEIGLSIAGNASGVALAPFTFGISYPVMSFLGGYGGSVTSQLAVEGQEKISHGRAIYAGLVNLIPGGGTAKGVTKTATTVGKSVLKEGLKGAAIGGGDVAVRAVVDEKRPLTAEEAAMGFGFGFGAGSGIRGITEVIPTGATDKTKELFKKLFRMSKEDIDIAVAKGDILEEDIIEGMEDIAQSTQSKPKPETPVATRMDTTDVGQMSYKELQAKAKELDIKANQKKVDLQQQVTEKLESLPPPPKTAGVDSNEIKEAIRLTEEILVNRKDGSGARVTRDVKKIFRRHSQMFFDDISTLITTKDPEVAKSIRAKLDDYIEFDRVISKKDYNDGASLQANSKKGEFSTYIAGLTDEANQRTANLEALKDMLDDFASPKTTGPLKGVAEDALEVARRNTQGLTPDQKLDRIASHLQKTFEKPRTGPLMQAVDTYYSVRLVQLLNQTKTALVGVPSATIMSVVRPVINTPLNIRKSFDLKDVKFSRRMMYANADLLATWEYVTLLSKRYKELGRSMGATFMNRGDSNFLYKDRQAFVADQLTESRDLPHVIQRKMRQSTRRVEAQEAAPGVKKDALTLKANVLNSRPAQAVSHLYDYGLSLIGTLEEASLIAHSLREARAIGIKQGIDNGVDDVWKHSSEFVDSTLDTSRGTLQASYDPQHADIFNTARRDHFRAMDLDINDIRRNTMDGMIAGINKVASSPDEVGLISRMLFVFVGVPVRALGTTASYTIPGAVYNVAKSGLGKVAAKTEKLVGRGEVSFGKYNKKIADLEVKIKKETANLNSENADVADQASKIIAEAENELATVKGYQQQEDYEAMGKLAIGTAGFIMGYEMAKNGHVTGTDSWLTDEQRFAASKVQGAPNSYKVMFEDGEGGVNEYDYRYFDPMKATFALGADFYKYQQLKETGGLTEEQTLLNFSMNFTKSIATESPFTLGLKRLLQTLDPKPEVQERGAKGIFSSALVYPAELRNIARNQQDFVGDATQGDFLEEALNSAMGQANANFRLTTLGEPKLREEPSLGSYVIPFAAKKVPEREAIDNIMLEDAYRYQTFSDTPTSFEGLKLKEYQNEDGKTLYSFYGEQITKPNKRGVTLRQQLNQMINTGKFKKAYDNGKYVEDENGTFKNEGVEMLKEVISARRREVRDSLIDTRKKQALDFYNAEGQSIYDIMQERQFAQPNQVQVLEELEIQ